VVKLANVRRATAEDHNSEADLLRWAGVLKAGSHLRDVLGGTRRMGQVSWKHAFDPVFEALAGAGWGEANSDIEIINAAVCRLTEANPNPIGIGIELSRVINIRVLDREPLVPAGWLQCMCRRPYWRPERGE
jgi:hypothetical protein